ncbi:MAG: hypothetical protein D6675_11970 [Gemmatimonadetes bacterium]|nr:MAG: hypothetical protein D6675_11970 [Gemmatimonadota bacterium]
MAYRRQYTIPFSAIVGQDELKLALILNTINPRIGGLLVRGPKGTGKSTAVYALAHLLPEREIVSGCRYNCLATQEEYLCADCQARLSAGEPLPTVSRKMQVIPLPLSISEDRLIGAIDMEKMLSEGQKAFQPGLLATANHNFLYVDEINLLPDHITDDILDAASLGWNTVEREGFSISHPARFILVGTMNPEEGELRPQLLDRLPLSVTLKTLTDESARVEIIRRNLISGQNPQQLHDHYHAEEKALGDRILQAQHCLHQCEIEEYQLRAIATTCIQLKVDGHRPEIIITRTALTLAAYHDHPLVTESDLLTACQFALGHRTRDGGFDAPATPTEIKKTLENALAKHAPHKKQGERFSLPPYQTTGKTGTKHHLASPTAGGEKKK